MTAVSMSSQSFASDNCQIINFNLSNRNLHKCRAESGQKSAKNSIEGERDRGREGENSRPHSVEHDE